MERWLAESTQEAPWNGFIAESGISIDTKTGNGHDSGIYKSRDEDDNDMHEIDLSLAEGLDVETTKGLQGSVDG